MLAVQANVSKGKFLGHAAVQSDHHNWPGHMVISHNTTNNEYLFAEWL